MGRHRSTEQQLSDAQARLDQLRQQARKEDTRRKVIIGSLMLSLAKDDDNLRDFLKCLLDERLSERDRRLFVEKDHLGLAIAGLYVATLHPVRRQPGWAVLGNQ